MLYALESSNPKLRTAILKNADDELIRTISEIAYNIIRGNVPLSKKRIEKLKKYKIQLRKLATPSRSLTLKRKVCVQKGGGIVLAVLGSILSGIVGRLLAKNV